MFTKGVEKVDKDLIHIIALKENKIYDLQKENKQLKEVYQDREDDIEFYWSMFHQIESIRINPNTSDDEKWEKIGELISTILEPKDC
jgi:hypothetical protein